MDTSKPPEPSQEEELISVEDYTSDPATPKRPQSENPVEEQQSRNEPPVKRLRRDYYFQGQHARSLGHQESPQDAVKADFLDSRIARLMEMGFSAQHSAEAIQSGLTFGEAAERLTVKRKLEKVPRIGPGDDVHFDSCSEDERLVRSPTIPPQDDPRFFMTGALGVTIVGDGTNARSYNYPDPTLGRPNNPYFIDDAQTPSVQSPSTTSFDDGSRSTTYFDDEGGNSFAGNAAGFSADNESGIILRDDEGVLLEENEGVLLDEDEGVIFGEDEGVIFGDDHVDLDDNQDADLDDDEDLHVNGVVRELVWHNWSPPVDENVHVDGGVRKLVWRNWCPLAEVGVRVVRGQHLSPPIKENLRATGGSPPIDENVDDNDDDVDDSNAGVDDNNDDENVDWSQFRAKKAEIMANGPPQYPAYKSRWPSMGYARKNCLANACLISVEYGRLSPIKCASCERKKTVCRVFKAAEGREGLKGKPPLKSCLCCLEKSAQCVFPKPSEAQTAREKAAEEEAVTLKAAKKKAVERKAAQRKAAKGKASKVRLGVQHTEDLRDAETLEDPGATDVRPIPREMLADFRGRLHLLGGCPPTLTYVEGDFGDDLSERLNIIKNFKQAFEKRIGEVEIVLYSRFSKVSDTPFVTMRYATIENALKARRIRTFSFASRSFTIGTRPFTGKEVHRTTPGLPIDETFGDVPSMDMRCTGTLVEHRIRLAYHIIRNPPASYSKKFDLFAADQEEHQCWQPYNVGNKNAPQSARFTFSCPDCAVITKIDFTWRQLCAMFSMEVSDSWKLGAMHGSLFWPGSHLCSQGDCIRPSHIRIESQKDNRARDECKKVGTCLGCSPRCLEAAFRDATGNLLSAMS